MTSNEPAAAPITPPRPAWWRERWALALAFGLVGIALRVFVIVNSKGTNDTHSWRVFGDAIAHGGIIDLYLQNRWFNHPPLMGYWAALTLKLEAPTGIRFDVWFKLLPLAGDIFAAVVLYRVWRRRDPVGATAAMAVGVLALSLNSILVTGHHTNTDPLCVALAVLGAYFWESRRYLAAGLALGAAMNVKLIPVFLIPMLALQARRWKDLFQFAGGLAVGAIPFVPILVRAGDAFYRNAVAYNSGAALWGIYGFLDLGRHDRNVVWFTAPVIRRFWESGRWLVVAAVLTIAVLGRRRRCWTPYELTFAAMAAFLTLAPGFGLQYTIFVLPFLVAVRPRDALVYATAAGLFTLVTYLYFWTGTRPWYSNFTSSFPNSAVVIGYVTWGYLLRVFASVLARGWKRGEEGALTR